MGWDGNERINYGIKSLVQVFLIHTNNNNNNAATSLAPQMTQTSEVSPCCSFYGSLDVPYHWVAGLGG